MFSENPLSHKSIRFISQCGRLSLLARQKNGKTSIGSQLLKGYVVIELYKKKLPSSSSFVIHTTVII
jgi:hypothetical protein